MNAAFHIEKIVPSSSAGDVDVHVRYDGGAAIFTLPRTYPKATVLSHIRQELRAILLEQDVRNRLASLIGKHDL